MIPDLRVPRMDEVLAKARAISDHEQDNWRYYRSPHFTIEGWRKLHQVGIHPNGMEER